MRRNLELTVLAIVFIGCGMAPDAWSDFARISPAPPGDSAAAGEPAPSAQVLADTGVRLWGLGLFDDAARLLKAAAEGSPCDVRTNYYLIECLAEHKPEAGEALSDYVSVVRERLSKNTCAELHYILGHALLRQDKLDDGYAEIAAARAAGFSSPYLDLDLAFLAAEEYDREGSLRLVGSVPAEALKEPIILRACADRLGAGGPGSTGHYLALAPALEDVLKIRPECALLWAELGYVYATGSDFANAERCFKTARALAPASHNVYDFYKQYLFDVGRLDEYARIAIDHRSGCDSCRSASAILAYFLASAGMRDLGLAVARDAATSKKDRTASSRAAVVEEEIAFFKGRDRVRDPLDFVTGPEGLDKALAREVSALPRFVVVRQAEAGWNRKLDEDVLADREVRDQLEKCILIEITPASAGELTRVEPLWGGTRQMKLPFATLLGPTGRPLATIERSSRPDRAAKDLKAAIDLFASVDIEAMREARGIAWNAALDAALKEAKEGAKGVVLYVTDPRDPWCRRMDAEVLSDGSVQAALSAFEAVRADDPAVASRFGVTLVPSLLFLDADGKEIHRITGFAAPDVLYSNVTAFMKKRSSGSWKTPSAAIRWCRDLDFALDAAKRLGKPVLIDVYTDWCGPCRYLDEKVFPTESVHKAVGGGFVPLKVNPEIDLPFSKRLPVSAYPTTIVLSPQGLEMKRFVGAMDARQYLEQIDLAAFREIPKGMTENDLASVMEKLRAAERHMESTPKRAASEIAELSGTYSTVPAVWRALATARAASGDLGGSMAALRKALDAPGAAGGSASDTVFQSFQGAGVSPENLMAAARTLAAEVGGEKGARVLMALSEHLAEREKLDAAVESAGQATRMAPRLADGWTQLATVSFLAGRLGEAERAISTALRLSPDDAFSVAIKATFLKASGKDGDAAALLTAAVRNRGSREPPLEKLSALQARLDNVGKTRESISAAWAAAALAPEDADILNAYGYALADAGEDLDTAIALAKKAISLNGDEDTANMWDTLAWAYFRKGDVYEARNAIGQAVNRYGAGYRSAEVSYHLGAIDAKLGLTELAKQELESVAASSEPAADDRSTPARAYRELQALKK